MPRSPFPGICLLLLLIGGLAAPVNAQGARGLPDPVSSSSLVDSLLGSGLAEDDLELVAVPLDRYLAAFRTLRAGPIETWLESRRATTRGLLGAPDDGGIEDQVEARITLAGRIAALDERLFDDLREAGLDAEIVDRTRERRARDRSLTLAGGRYTRGLRFEPSLVYAEVADAVDRSPQWALDAVVREIIQTHDRERTRRLGRLATLAMEVPIERQRRIAESDAVAPVLDPEDPEGTQAALERWFTNRREAERAAAGEVRAAQAALMVADLEALDRIVATTGSDTPFATAFRAAWLAAAHPRHFPDRESPVALFERARSEHESGGIDDETLESVTAVEASWRSRHRDLEARLTRAVAKATRAGESSGGFMIFGEDRTPRETTEVDRLRQDRADLDREVRDTLAGMAPEALASRIPTGGLPAGFTLDAAALGGAALEGAEVSIAIVAEPGNLLGDGEGMVLELDDLDFGDGAVFVSSVAGGIPGLGGGEGLPRPLDAEGFAEIREACGDDESTTPILDAMFADYRAGWREIDETLVEAWKATPRGGLVPMGGSPASADDIERGGSLRSAILDAVLTLDRTLFDDLAVVVNRPETLRRLADRRRRDVCIAVATKGPFGDGDRTADLDLEAIGLAILPPRTEELLRAWAGDLTPLLEARARKIIDADLRLALARLDLQQRIQQDTGNATAVSIEMDGAQVDVLRSIQEIRDLADRSVADVNGVWIARIAREVSGPAEEEFRLAVDREAWPSCFEDRRSPASNFDRALALDDLDEGSRIAITALRNEWRGDWTAACRRLVELERAGGFDPMAIDPETFDPAALQKSMADKRRVRFERNEVDEKAIRELHTLLSEEQREIVGGLPAERKRMLMPGMGDIETIIGG